MPDDHHVQTVANVVTMDSVPWVVSASKRHGGQQRPESVIVKHGWRLIEKRLMADAT